MTNNTFIVGVQSLNFLVFRINNAIAALPVRSAASDKTTARSIVINQLRNHFAGVKLKYSTEYSPAPEEDEAPFPLGYYFGREAK